MNDDPIARLVRAAWAEQPPDDLEAIVAEAERRQADQGPQDADSSARTSAEDLKILLDLLNTLTGQLPTGESPVETLSVTQVYAVVNAVGDHAHVSGLAVAQPSTAATDREDERPVSRPGRSPRPDDDQDLADEVDLRTDDVYVRTFEVAEILHVSPKTISRWAKDGKLPYVKTSGGHRRFPLREIERLARDSDRSADDVAGW